MHEVEDLERCLLVAIQQSRKPVAYTTFRDRYIRYYKDLEIRRALIRLRIRKLIKISEAYPNNKNVFYEVV